MLCLLETKIYSPINDTEITLPVYCLFRHNHDRRGGGVAVYCRHELSPIRLNTNSKTEHCAVTVKFSVDLQAIICCVYRRSQQTCLTGLQASFHFWRI